MYVNYYKYNRDNNGWNERYEYKYEYINNTYFNLLYIAIIILIIYSLNEIDKSSKCECGKDNRRFIKEWFIFLLFFKIFFIVIYLIVISVSPFNFETIGIISIIFIVMYLITGLITFIMEIRLLIYLFDIRKNCDCVYKLKEKILFWFYIIYFLLFSLYFVTIIPLMIIAFRMFNYR